MNCLLAECTSPSQRQTSITGAFAKPHLLQSVKPSKQAMESFYKVLAWSSAVDLRPMCMVDGIGFRKICEHLNPNYKPPSRTTLTKYVGVLYDEVS